MCLFIRLSGRLVALCLGSWHSRSYAHRVQISTGLRVALCFLIRYLCIRSCESTSHVFTSVHVIQGPRIENNGELRTTDFDGFRHRCACRRKHMQGNE
ncbi:hypothetical protein BDW22DRAFT_915631 [Trametopsis cervina]|nr:hypothetical protein BDW22DRAFT_915631 [Trametopsis cervina]